MLSGVETSVTRTQRIEVDPDRPPVEIPAAVYNELCAHAMEADPEECCGLLTGTSEEPFRTVYRCTNVMTKMHLSDPETFPRDARHAFYMNEIEYLKAQETAEREGEEVSAIYHSHVGVGAYLSADDLRFAEHELFPFPEAVHIVLGLSQNVVRAAGVFVRDRMGALSGHPLAVAK